MWKHSFSPNLALQLLLCLVIVPLCCHCAISRASAGFADRAHLDRVVSARRSRLALPDILDPHTAPRQFVDVEHCGRSDRRVVGVMVENFSR